MRSFGCLYQQVLCRMEVGVGWKLMGKEIGLSVPATCLQLRSACCFLRMSSASIWQTHQFAFSPRHEQTKVSCVVIICEDRPVRIIWFPILLSTLFSHLFTSHWFSGITSYSVPFHLLRCTMKILFPCALFLNLRPISAASLWTVCPWPRQLSAHWRYPPLNKGDNYN